MNKCLNVMAGGSITYELYMSSKDLVKILNKKLFRPNTITCPKTGAVFVTSQIARFTERKVEENKNGA